MNNLLPNIIACLLFFLSTTIGHTQSASYAGQKIIAFADPDSLLPPKSMPLPDLKVKKGKNNSVLLEWPTENPFDAKYLEVERSSDGTNFLKLGEWTLNSFKDKSSYTYLDERPLPVSYYRAKIVDEGGNHNYSKVAVVNQNGAFHSAIQPNPFVQSFTVDIYVADAQAIKIQLLDISGRLLRYKSVAGKAGNNKIEFDDVGSLQPGIYMVRIVRGYSVTEKKVIRSN